MLAVMWDLKMIKKCNLSAKTILKVCQNKAKTVQWFYCLDFCLNTIQNGGGGGGGGGAKTPPPPPINFSPVTSTNVRSSLQNFLTFSFPPIDRLV